MKPQRKRPTRKEPLSKIVMPFLKQYSKRVSAGTFIFKENETADYVYLVVNGLVKLTKKCSLPKDMQLTVILPGNFAGLEAVFPYGYYYCSAIASTECTLCAVPKDIFQREFNKFNKNTFLIMDEIYKEINETEEGIYSIEARNNSMIN